MTAASLQKPASVFRNRPFLLLCVFVDRHDPRVILVATNLLRAAAFLAIVVAASVMADRRRERRPAIRR